MRERGEKSDVSRGGYLEGRKERGREGERKERKHAPGAHGGAPLFGKDALDNGDADGAFFDEGTSFQHAGGSMTYSPVTRPLVHLERGACTVFVLRVEGRGRG